VTGDEGRFGDEDVRTWTGWDKKTHEITRRTVASRKSILAVLWNSHGFHVVPILPLRASFNASWFIDGNLVPLVEKFFPVE
jgi:hypothetical protein